MRGIFHLRGIEAVRKQTRSVGSHLSGLNEEGIRHGLRSSFQCQPITLSNAVCLACVYGEDDCRRVPNDLIMPFLE